MFLPYADDAPRDPRIPVVTWVLIGLNIIVASHFDFELDQSTADTWGFVPAWPSLTTALTSMFLHGGIAHLLVNLWFLFVFGNNVELRLGRWKYLSCYLLSGLGGALCHFIFNLGSDIPTVGASGAVFGVMGMYLYLFPNNRVKVFYFLLIIFGTWQIPAVWVIGFWFLKEAFLSYLSAHGMMESGVGHLAHSGGFMVGLGLAHALVKIGVVKDDGWTLPAWLAGRRKRRVTLRAVPITGPRVAKAPPERSVMPSKSEALALLIRQGQMEPALQLWRREFSNDANLILPPPEQLTLGEMLERAGFRQAAREAFKRLLLYYPGQQPFAAEAHFFVAGLMLEEAKDYGDRQSLPEIVHHLREVIQTHPYPARREVAAGWLASVESAM